MADKIRKAGKYDEYTQRARDIRMKDGEKMERVNLDKSERRVGESTHLMRTEYIDDRWVSFPTLFPHKEKPNRWIEYPESPNDPQAKMAYDEAGTRGERFEFGQDKEAAIKFGLGTWKPK